MKDLAPDIVRQRLLIEGFYSTTIDGSSVRDFLLGLPAHLGLRSYGEVTIHAPSGQGRDANEGYDAFVPLIDSGMSLYVWTRRRFLAVVVFSCKHFAADRAVSYTREAFAMSDLAHEDF